MSEHNINPQNDTGNQRIPAGKNNTHSALGLAGLTPGRQIGLLAVLVFSVAIGVAVVLWALPPADEASAAKPEPAAQGLPGDHAPGYELLDKDRDSGAVKSAEMINFKRALEGEIARIIMSIENVKSARVLLALPAQPEMAGVRHHPSASVMVGLYQDRTLDAAQIDSIIRLVASSVPQLEPQQVTIVDQRGRLLASSGLSSASSLNSGPFEYKKRLEEHLMERIANILSPLVGADAMRAVVSADIDFSGTDKNRQRLNPDIQASIGPKEQNATPPRQKIPGISSNLSEPASVAPGTAVAQDDPASGTKNAQKPSAKNAAKDFDPAKTGAVNLQADGVIRRLSAAVVIDDRHLTQDDGTIKKQPYTREDIRHFSELVQQAIGFDGSRGDQVKVTNAAFKTPVPQGSVPQTPVWEQDWFRLLMKQLIAGLVLLLLLFGVLRPVIFRLSDRKPEPKKADAHGVIVRNDEPAKSAATASGAQPAEITLPAGMPGILLQDLPQGHEQRLDYLKKLVDEDPRIVAQVLKTWMKKDG